jgi:hypothetical protein
MSNTAASRFFFKKNHEFFQKQMLDPKKINKIKLAVWHVPPFESAVGRCRRARSGQPPFRTAVAPKGRGF